MVRMLESVDDETLFDLKKKRDSGKKTLAHLSNELCQLPSRVKEKTAQLVEVNRQYAVMESKIRDCQNRLFYIRDQVSAFDENAYRMKEELESRQKQLAKLKRKRQQIVDDIISVQEENREVSKRVRALEEESGKLSARLDERKLVKQKEGKAISAALENTSFDREEMEEKITKLNNAFMASVEERTAVTTRLTEITKAVDKLREENGRLEKKKGFLEQFQSLLGEHDALTLEVREANGQTDTLDRTLEELKEQLKPLRQQFDNLKEKNRSRMEEMMALEEELVEYDEAVTKHRIARDEKDQVLNMNKQGMKALMQLLTETMKLENGIPMMKKKMEVIRGLLP